MRFFAELKHRNVIRMAGLYLVGAWLLAPAAGTLLPVFDAPAWVTSIPAGLSMSTALLKLDPTWDPLRNDPRLRKPIAVTEAAQARLKP